MGSGEKHIVDASGSNTLVLLGGIHLEVIRLGLGSLKISTGLAGDDIHLDGVDYQDLAGTSPIASIQFSDGLTMSIAEVIAAVGIDLAATAGSDTINGTSGRDLVDALAGDDGVDAGGGDDGFADNLPITSNSIAACGLSVGVAGRFGFEFGAFEGRKRCWRWRIGRCAAMKRICRTPVKSNRGTAPFSCKGADNHRAWLNSPRRPATQEQH